MLRVLLPALALLPPSVTCWQGQHVVPPEDVQLRSCDNAEPQGPAALRNATPCSSVLPDGLSGCAVCSAVCYGLLQPVVLEALDACRCVRPPELIRSSVKLLAAPGCNGAGVVDVDQLQSRSATEFHWWPPQYNLLVFTLIGLSPLWLRLARHV